MSARRATRSSRVGDPPLVGPASPRKAKDAALARDLARALDPAMFLEDADLKLDEWQQQVLGSAARRQLLLCSRQVGKSTVASALALHTATTQQDALVLLVSPSLRQSQELFRKVTTHMRRMGDDAPDPSAESALRLEFRGGSRIVSLPGSETTIRGYSAPRLVIVDEAAHCADALLGAIFPMLATVPDARLLALTTPNGTRGWFYEAWHGADADWEKTKITWRQCPRISREAVELYRRTAGELMYRQEFEVEFLDENTSVFPSEIIERAINPHEPAWRI